MTDGSTKQVVLNLSNVSPKHTPKTDDKHHYQAMLLTTNGNSQRVAIVILWAHGLIIQIKEMKHFRSQP